MGSSASRARALVWSGPAVSRCEREDGVGVSSAWRAGTQVAGSTHLLAADVDPLDERVVEKGLEDRAQAVLVGSEDAQGDLGRPPVDACTSRGESAQARRRRQSSGERSRRTFDARDAHAVDDVVREPERDLLGDLERATLRACGQVSVLAGKHEDEDEQTHLVEEAVEVDVDRVARGAVEEDVLAVPVAEPARRRISIVSRERVRDDKERETHPRTKPTIEMTAAVRE